MTATQVSDTPISTGSTARSALQAVAADITAEISSRRRRRALLARSDSRDALIRSAALEYELDGLLVALAAVSQRIVALEG